MSSPVRPHGRLSHAPVRMPDAPAPCSIFRSDTLDINVDDNLEGASQQELNSKLVGRARMAEASGSEEIFDKLTQCAHMLHRRMPCKKVRQVPPRTIVAQATDYMTKVKAMFSKDTPIDILRLVVAGLVVHQLRLTDISMRDKVAILYLSCGDELRAHSGRVYCFTQDAGHMKPYSGLISDTILKDIQDFLLTLEGLFRMMGGSGHVGRNLRAVLKESHRVLMDLQDKSHNDWKKSIIMLKKASLSHEGDEQAKQERLIDNHSRKVVVKSRIDQRNQAALPTQPAAAIASESLPAPSQAIGMGTCGFDDADETLVPNEPHHGASATVDPNEDDDAPKAWHVYVAQNLAKVPFLYFLLF